MIALAKPQRTQRKPHQREHHQRKHQISNPSTHAQLSVAKAQTDQQSVLV